MTGRPKSARPTLLAIQFSRPALLLKRKAASSANNRPNPPPFDTAKKPPFMDGHWLNRGGALRLLPSCFRSKLLKDLRPTRVEIPSQEAVRSPV